MYYDKSTKISNLTSKNQESQKKQNSTTQLPLKLTLPSSLNPRNIILKHAEKPQDNEESTDEIAEVVIYFIYFAWFSNHY